MTEILTESFCERCGTRYTFESARPRARLKGVKVLSRGLKNFVLSDDTSMDEAMAAARSETEREATAHQLDAFHRTFNFCMSCRQYTCPNCWNEPEARCLTCAPLALPELAESPGLVDDLRAFRNAALAGHAEPANGTYAPADEPAADIEPAETQPPDTGPAGVAAIEVAAVEAAPEAMSAEPVPIEAESEPVQSEAEPSPEVPAADLPPAAVDHAGKAAAQTAGLLRRFRPGQSLDAELDAFERQREEADAVDAAPDIGAASEPTAEAQAVETPEAQPEPLEPEVPAAQVAEPEAVIQAPEEPEAPEVVMPAPEPGPETQPLAAAAAADVVEQPTWRITAPDSGGPTAPLPPLGGEAGLPVRASGTPATPPGGEPQWPSRPQWPSGSPAAGLPFLGRPANPEGGIDALWAASNQELVTAVPAPQGRTASGIQPCISCGLSLSANARFCRRCGTLQNR